MPSKRRQLLAVLPMLLAAALATGAATPLSAAQQPIAAPRIAPQTVSMGAFYNGASVHIDGTAPAGAGVLIAIEGSERDEFFERKGRVGPIWLTVDKIHVKHAPSVFLRYSSTSIGSLLDRDEIRKYGLDETAIVGRLTILSHCKCSSTDRTRQSGANDEVPDASYAGVLSSDFLQLKVQEGAYKEHPGSVRLTPAGPATFYDLVVQWPKNAMPGNYRVNVYACRGGRVVAQASSPLKVAEVGFPAYIAKLAESRPWTYGVVAVLAAVLAGFLTDLITSSLRRKRRPKTRDGAPDPDCAVEELPNKVSDAEMAHKD